jgi:hypothetical protein
MAEEVLVKEPLRSELLEAGKNLTKLLAASDLQLRWSFWLYASETNDWRLILATPLVDSEGPKKVYSRIREIVSGSSDASLTLLNISVQGMQNAYVKALEGDRFLQYDLKSSNLEIRLSRTRIGDVFVEDAVLYQLPPKLPVKNQS